MVRYVHSDDDHYDLLFSDVTARSLGRMAALTHVFILASNIYSSGTIESGTIGCKKGRPAAAVRR